MSDHVHEAVFPTAIGSIAYISQVHGSMPMCFAAIFIIVQKVMVCPLGMVFMIDLNIYIYLMKSIFIFFSLLKVLHMHI